MACMPLSFTTSPKVSNMVFSGSSGVGLGPHAIISGLRPSKKTTSRPSLVVRAQQNEWKNMSQSHLNERLDPQKIPALFETSCYESTPWAMKDEGNIMEMWFNMAEVEVRDIQVYIKDHKLCIQRLGDHITSFGRPMLHPYKKIQLPANCRKEDVVAKFGNGVLYISAPKSTESDTPYDIQVENEPIT